MRTSLAILLTILIGPNLLLAQHKDGYLKYHVDVVVADTTQETMQASRMLRNSKVEIYVRKNKYRIDTKMGTLFQNSMRHDEKKEETLILTTSEQGKFAQKYVNQKLRGSSTKNENIVVNEYRDSTRKILGFKCFYVQLISNGNTSNYWCSEEIDFIFEGDSFVDPSLPAFPLMIQKYQGGFQFTYTASNFRKKIDSPKEVFTTEVPDGYTLKPNNR